ncbi:MAG: cobalamin B12-binding domain-containing protein [Deltaproteobacteria bacterium]|nr:cobalamin B12-binding domain-containing protein [Deltaproteobacteria bacterium]
MHVVLIGAELEENLALRYLAAALEARGHTFELAPFDRAGDEQAVIDAVLRARPPVVGMSMTFQFRAREFGALAQSLRDAGYQGHIVVGGHFPTFAFREVLERFPAIDGVVRHEGEETLPELCEALAQRRPLHGIRGLVFRGADGAVIENPPRALITDLDALPFPKRLGPTQLHLGIPAAFMVGSRGCYGHCTFCCIHAYIRDAGGPKYRARSPENIADEIAEIRKTRGARMLVFHDDDFFTRDAARDLERMTALRDALRARGVHDVALVVKARPDDVDPKVFAVLREIGLLRVYLGIEAGSTQGLKTLGRSVELSENRRALAWLQAQDLYTCYNMLAFDPESTIGSLRDSFQFVRDHATVPMNFCRTEIYVGTPLMTKLAREGRLIGDVFGWDYDIRDDRADRAFRVFARAFLDRNFRCDGLMNATLGLGYQLHLLRQFHPHAMRPELRTRVDELTAKVNLDSMARMDAILDFAASPASDDPRALEAFTCEATEQANLAGRALEEEVAEATMAIVRAAETPARPPRERRVNVWQALSAAAIAVSSPMMSNCQKPPPPPDPLPEPTIVADDVGPRPDVQPATTTTPTVVDPLPPPTTHPTPPPHDPLPPPTTHPTGPHYPPPPDPLPPPTTKPKYPPPPDPLPYPTTKPKYPPPPDPLPKPQTKKTDPDF